MPVRLRLLLEEKPGENVNEIRRNKCLSDEITGKSELESAKNLRDKKVKKVLFASFAGLFAISAMAQPIVKRFEWGIETWQMGANDFPISFSEKGPVKILGIEGNLTAAPQPEFQPSEQMIRQTLATLVDVGDTDDPMDVTVTGKPAERANHVVSPHLFSINVKQTNAGTENIPISYNYRDAPLQLHQNKLMVHIFNESYRYTKKDGCFVSKDQKDALNVEIHLTVTYQVDSETQQVGRVDRKFLEKARAWMPR